MTRQAWYYLGGQACERAKFGAVHPHSPTIPHLLLSAEQSDSSHAEHCDSSLNRRGTAPCDVTLATVPMFIDVLCASFSAYYLCIV